MIETSARLLSLLSLLQMRREWAGSELSDRLEVSERTIRRDVDRLRSLGYPIDATRGAAGGYRLGAGGDLPPLLLDDDEAVAVAVGLRTAANGTISGIEETSIRALAKLEQVLPNHLRRRVNAVQSAMVAMTGNAPLVSAESLAVIAGAVRDHEQLRIVYRKYNKDEMQRVIEPIRMVAAGRRWYLVAWDVDRADWRTFRVDRILRTPSIGARFEPREPPSDDLAAWVSRRVTGAWRYTAEIVIHAPLAEAEKYTSPTSASLEAIDEHSCLMRTGANSLWTLTVHIAMMDVDFEVRSPPELVASVRKLAARLASAA